MPFSLRPAAALVAAVSLAAAPAVPAVAGARPDPARASTPLTARIRDATRFGVGIEYILREGGRPVVASNLGASAESTGDAIATVGRTHADAAQYQAKLEWILGAEQLAGGDLRLARGEHDLVYGHPSGERFIADGLADYRRANDYLAQADTILGVPHPRLAARPYRSSRTAPAVPAPAVTPTVPVTAHLSLPATVRMSFPVTEETLPGHLHPSDLFSLLAPDEDAVAYYSVLAGHMHVSPAQRPAQREWITGLRTQHSGDALLVDALYDRGGSRMGDAHDLAAGLTALRRGDAQITRADAMLGLHQGRPSARLPRTVIAELNPAVIAGA